jgi:hypothetical protein
MAHPNDDLGSILAWLYPDASPLYDYRVQQDSEEAGPYIAYWDAAKLGPQPTTAEVMARRDEWLAATRRRKRTLLSILDSLNALTAAQKTAIGNDLFTMPDPKALTDAGPNAVGIFTLYWAVNTGGISPADKNLAKLYAAAYWAQDNPKAFVNPPYDPTINVPGDEPIP